MNANSVLSGILSGSQGQALSRVAARVRPSDALTGVSKVAGCGGCGTCATCRGTSVSDARSVSGRFDLRDTVELSPAAEQAARGTRGYEELTKEEQARVDELKEIDQRVRQHEAAHLAAAGGFARGGASFDYTTGPDGKRYATSGEVQIDTSPVPDDPEATIAKMETVKRAALAPAEPSSQDYRVAAKADVQLREAQAALAERDANEVSGDTAGAAASEKASPAAESAVAAAEYDFTGRALRRATEAEPADGTAATEATGLAAGDTAATDSTGQPVAYALQQGLAAYQQQVTAFEPYSQRAAQFTGTHNAFA